MAIDNTISLLSIGVGFQPKLTGYENIFFLIRDLINGEDVVIENREDILRVIREGLSDG